MIPADKNKVLELLLNCGNCHWASSLWHLSLSLMAISLVQVSSVKDVVVAWRRRMKNSWVS